MHLLGFLLLALAAVSCCQAEPNCTGYISELTVDVFCTNLVDLTPLTAELATTEKPLHELIISNSQLTLKREDVDTPRLLNIVELDLSSNGWASFNSEPIQVLTKLDQLKLSHNNLTAITANTLAGLESLTRLSLDDNLIQTIDPAAFQSLKKLIRLNLNHNQIATIPAGLFSGVPLQTIKLRGNLLTSIDEETFNNVPSLVNLVLSANRIRTIDSRAFQNLPVLSQVELDLNKFEHLDGRLFENNPIVGLDLRDNNLENLSNFPLNFPSLIGLILSNCNITSIPDDYFKNVPNLYVLGLDDNKINTLQPGLLSPMTNLGLLILENNNLTSLNVASFEQIHELLISPERSVVLPEHVDVDTTRNKTSKPVVRLGNNPWDCSSPDMVELKAWSEQHDVDFNEVFGCTA